jgi:hypothetical protein
LVVWLVGWEVVGVGRWWWWGSRGQGGGLE